MKYESEFILELSVDLWRRLSLDAASIASCSKENILKNRIQIVILDELMQYSRGIIKKQIPP